MACQLGDQVVETPVCKLISNENSLEEKKTLTIRNQKVYFATDQEGQTPWTSSTFHLILGLAVDSRPESLVP